MGWVPERAAKVEKTLAEVKAAALAKGIKL